MFEIFAGHCILSTEYATIITWITNVPFEFALKPKPKLKQKSRTVSPYFSAEAKNFIENDTKLATKNRVLARMTTNAETEAGDGDGEWAHVLN